MKADDNRLFVVFGDQRKALKKTSEALRIVDVLRAMQRDEEICTGRYSDALKYVTRIDLLAVIIENLEDWIAGHEDSAAIDAFAHEIFLASFGIWHQHRAAMIDHPPIDFLRYAIVVTPVAGFHMVDIDAHSCGD